MTYHAGVERPIFERDSVPVNVVKISSRDLQHSLINNLLIRSRQRLAGTTSQSVAMNYLLNAKFQLLEALWNVVLHLLLHGLPTGGHELHFGYVICNQAYILL